jgi:hypothetical protein
MFPQSAQNRTIPQRTVGGKKLAADSYQRMKDFTLAAQGELVVMLACWNNPTLQWRKS